MRMLVTFPPVRVESKTDMKAKVASMDATMARPIGIHSVKDLPLVVAVQEKPLQAQGDLMSAHVHSAYPVEGSAQPIQVATRTLGFEAALGNAACHGVVCKENTAVDEGRSGSSGRQSMDL